MGIEDKLNQAKGALKEGTGKLTGDKKTEIEGAVEKEDKKEVFKPFGKRTSFFICFLN